MQAENLKEHLKNKYWRFGKDVLVRLIIISSLFMMVSCESNNDSPKMHPSPHLVFHDTIEYTKVSKQNIKQWDKYFSLNIKDTVVINISEKRYKIKSVTDALINDDEILILDDGTTKVQSIGFDGLPNKIVARKGRGPGEVSSPVNMVKNDDGFVVMDRVNGIIYYDNNNEPFKFERIKFMPDYFCMDENYFVKSSYLSSSKGVDNHLIFEVNKESEIVNKYSQKYDHDDNKLVYFMSSGPIECVNEYSTLVNAYTLALPLIEIYNTEKGESEKYKLVDINPYKYEFRGTLRRSNINLGTTYHRNGNLTILHDQFVVLQFYEIDRPNNPDTKFDPQVLSYIFDLKSNDIHYSYKLPYIRATSSNKIFVKNHRDEFTYYLHTYELVKN